MWKLLALLQNQLIWSVPIFMAAGILFGLVTDPGGLKDLIVPLTFLMVYPMMINLQFGKLVAGKLETARGCPVY